MAPAPARRFRRRVVFIAVVFGALCAMAAFVYRAGWWPGTASRGVTLLDPTQVIVVRTPGGLLEAATLVKVEEFGWQTTYTCPLIDCGKLLGATITRVRVPVHYTYRI
ncbi:MAG: hypothetical protein ABW051_04565, partial [Burkholderiaceae bacterium]